MNIKELLSVIATPILLTYSIATNADTIYLKSGDILSGQLITFENGLCVVKSYGVAIKIDTEQVQNFSTNEQFKIILESGESIIGFLSSSDGITNIHSDKFGDIPIDVKTITKLQRQFKRHSSSSTKSDSQEIGKPEETTTPLEFLSGSTVLLTPGTYQLELGLDYRTNRDRYTLPSVGPFENHSFTARQLRTEATVRGGLADGLEGFFTLPYTYTHIDQVSSNEFVRDVDETELGDISFGIQYEVVTETADRPATSWSIAVSVPTGEKRFYSLTDDWKDPLNNGSGHWSIATGLSFVRSTDPAILFGGFNIGYAFDETIDGYGISPGLTFNSYVGFGFALNDSLSIGSRFSYAYVSEVDVDGVEINGSEDEALDMSFSLSHRLSADWVVTPQVTFSLNDDAGASSASLRFNRSFN